MLHIYSMLKDYTSLIFVFVRLNVYDNKSNQNIIDMHEEAIILGNGISDHNLNFRAN